MPEIEACNSRTSRDGEFTPSEVFKSPSATRLEKSTTSPMGCSDLRAISAAMLPPTMVSSKAISAFVSSCRWSCAWTPPIRSPKTSHCSSPRSIDTTRIGMPESSVSGSTSASTNCVFVGGVIVGTPGSVSSSEIGSSPTTIKAATKSGDAASVVCRRADTGSWLVESVRPSPMIRWSTASSAAFLLENAARAAKSAVVIAMINDVISEIRRASVIEPPRT